jgi:hypothetical protein
MVYSDFQLCERFLVCATWAALAFWPTWPFHLFTDVFPADVIGIESGLVRYSLNYYFYRAYK